MKSQSVSKQYENAKDLLVNLGAGPDGKPGWINVDLYEAPGIKCVYDCRKILPFPAEAIARNQKSFLPFCTKKYVFIPTNLLNFN